MSLAPEDQDSGKIIYLTERPFAGAGGAAMLLTLGAMLVLVRLVIMGAIAGLVILVVAFGSWGFLALLVLVAAAGVITDRFVRRRELAGTLGSFVAQRRIGRPDGSEDTEYVDGATQRSMPFRKLLARDVVGIAVGTGVFVLAAILLAWLSGAG